MGDSLDNVVPVRNGDSVRQILGVDVSSLAAALVAVLATVVPPGKTAYSVEPAPTGRYSSYYGTTVAKESPTTALRRYNEHAEVMVEQAAVVIAETGNKNFTLPELVALTAAVAVQESGLREDVQVGRGRSGKPDDAQGEGRGPGNEGCAMQILPSSAWRFADAAPELKLLAAKGNAKAREAIVQSLLGHDRDSLRRCYRTGIRMLVRGASYCDGRKGYRADWAAVSVFVAGNSCDTDPHGKTAARVNLARRIYQRLAAKRS